MERAEKLTELTSIQEESIARADAIARIDELLADEDLEVRLEAIRALQSYPEAHEQWRWVLGLAIDEPGPLRSAALQALGILIRAGDLAGAGEEGYAPDEELGEPSPELFSEAREALLERLAEPASPEEKRAALSSLSWLAHLEPVVAGIEELWASGETEDKRCALRCMGQGGDGQRWGATLREVVEEGDDALIQVGVEAAGLAEQLELAPLVARILKSERQSAPLRIAAANALAGFGGKAGAAHLLELAESSEQSPVHEAAREALASLTAPASRAEEGHDDA